jgi:carbon storage regulator CsrA
MSFPLLNRNNMHLSVGQSVIVNFDGHEVFVVMTATKGNQATFRIDAPRIVPIHREEIAQRIAKEERAAASGRFAVEARA